MHSLTRIVPALALLVAMPACDGDDKDMIHDSSSTGESASDSSGSESGSESDGGSETDAGEVVCDAESVNSSRACAGGTQFCFSSDGVEFAWGSCVASPVCVPGTGDECEACVLNEQGVPTLIDNCEGGTSTPLVLNFDGAPVEYGSAGKHFDLGTCAATDWPTARTPWLALDRDRSGHIDEGSELFGSATRLRSGGLADNGFTALSELDADRDGKITAADPKFSELVLWADGDADRRSSGLELQSLHALGLVSIELGYASDRRCDARANCEVERASFVWRDGLGREQTGEVIDVHLACQ